jgi:hypothetical protein
MKDFPMIAVFAVFFAGCAPVDEADLNPKTCGALADDVTLSCTGSGVAGELYTCDCSKVTAAEEACSADATTCSIGDRCLDGLCSHVASFTDDKICIDGINAEEVATRCAGLPQD